MTGKLLVNKSYTWPLSKCQKTGDGLRGRTALGVLVRCRVVTIRQNSLNAPWHRFIDLDMDIAPKRVEMG